MSINARYRATIMEHELGVSKTPSAWLSGYEFFDPSVYDKKELWRTQQIKQWFKEYGQDYFKDLDIWDIPWKRYHTERSAGYLRGENFRSFADHILDDSNAFNPNDIQDGDIIFIQTNFLPIFTREYQPHITKNYILITHKSDWPLQGPCKDIINNPRVIAWFGTNPYFKHPKLIPIPFGLFPEVSDAEYEKYITSVQRKTPQKQHLAYMNFAVNDYDGRTDRIFVWNYFRDFLFCHDMCYQLSESPRCSQEEYMTQLAESDFTISPAGSGLDCYRTYEALLAGSYPIVKSSCLDDLFNDLPVLIVNSWREVTPTLLRQKKEEFSKKTYDLKKLYTSYWKNTIKKMQLFHRYTSAITYEMSTGRLGDHLIAYCKAKQIAQQHTMPLLYKPFMYGDQLGIEEKELPFEDSDMQHFKKVQYISDLNDPSINAQSSTLYILSKQHWQNPIDDQDGTYHISTNNSLKKALQETLKPPATSMSYYKIPGYITVAMHIRTGANHESDINLLKSHTYHYATQATNNNAITEDQEVVLKFPSLSFYYEQLMRVITALPGRKLHLNIYTDHPRPELLAEALTQNIDSSRLICTYRQNNMQDNILQDMFDMAQADILIRPRSGLSIIAQLIGQHAVVIWPKKGHWNHDGFIIDDVGIHYS